MSKDLNDGLSSVKEVAELYEVSVQTVHSWIRRGCPYIEGSKGRQKVYRIDLDKVDAYLKEKQIGPYIPEAETAEKVISIRAQLDQQKLDKNAIDLEKARLDYDVKRGLYFMVEEIEAGRLERIAAVKGAMMAVAGRVSGRLAMRDADYIYDEIEKEMREICETFAEEGD